MIDYIALVVDLVDPASHVRQFTSGSFRPSLARRAVCTRLARRAVAAVHTVTSGGTVDPITAGGAISAIPPVDTVTARRTV